jgi:hypothetical protein
MDAEKIIETAVNLASFCKLGSGLEKYAMCMSMCLLNPWLVIRKNGEQRVDSPTHSVFLQWVRNRTVRAVFLLLKSNFPW